MKGPAPLRFVALVLGGWIGFRIIALSPTGTEPAVGPLIAGPQARSVAAERLAQPGAWQPAGPSPPLAFAGPGVVPLPVKRLQWATPTTGAPIAASSPIWPPAERSAPPPHPIFAAPNSTPPHPAPLAPFPLLSSSPGPGRWSASAWLFARPGGTGPGLATGGLLGGSQAGARLTYRLNGDPARPLAASLRAYASLNRPQESEVALGVDWRPFASLPVHLLAERRQAIGSEGRSDFALSVHGGAERRILGGHVRVEAYGQAGIVGIEKRDLFADGSLRAGLPVGPLEIGGGVWGGAQPGAARLDVGPQASVTIPVGPVFLRASAEWRLRVAGDAEPGSGPAFTLSAGF